MTYRVLAYHTVGRYDALLPSGIGLSPERFRQHMATLKAGGNVVPLEQLVGALARGEAPGGIAITFDDGWADCLAHALPTLEELALPATFFVPAGLLGQRVEMSGQTLPVVTAAELAALADRPGIQIGSHAMTHRSLAGLPAGELDRELAGSRELLERIVKRPVTLVSYPFGAFDDGVREAARRAGYTDGFSVWTRQEGPFARLRIPIHTHDGSLRFGLKASRLYFPLKRLVRP